MSGCVSKKTRYMTSVCRGSVPNRRYFTVFVSAVWYFDWLLFFTERPVKFMALIVSHFARIQLRISTWLHLHIGDTSSYFRFSKSIRFLDLLGFLNYTLTTLCKLLNMHVEIFYRLNEMYGRIAIIICHYFGMSLLIARCSSACKRVVEVSSRYSSQEINNRRFTFPSADWQKVVDFFGVV